MNEPSPRGRRSRRSRRRLRRPALERTPPDSPDYREPRCRHFGTCGGCRFQDLSDQAQLARLHERVVESFEPLRSYGEIEVEPMIGCESTFHYRNKMDFTFSARRWVEAHEPEGVDKDFAVGLHIPGRYDKVLDVEQCFIAFEEASGILSTVRRLAKELALAPWCVHEHHGLLRHLVLRKGIATGQIMANLVTTDDSTEALRPLMERCLEEHPEITTLVQNIHSGVSMVASGEREIVWHGEGVIEDQVGGLRFAISSNSFFQTNTKQAGLLVKLVREMVDVRPHEVLWDVCCGGGLLALSLADRCQNVWGFEIVPSAIEDAKRNAQWNGIDNVQFVVGDVADTITASTSGSLAEPPPDVCLLDPPRAGFHTKVLEALKTLAPRQIVYVSCHVESAVRDLTALMPQGYRIDRVAPLDLFPHTPHVEVVIAASRPKPLSGQASQEA